MTTHEKTADLNIECNCDELECNPNNRVAWSRKKKRKKDLSDFNKRFQAQGASRIAFVGDLSFINNWSH